MIPFLALLGLSAAQAGTVIATVHLDDDGPRLVDLVHASGPADPLPQGGDLHVLDEDGRVLAGFGLPDGLRERSVVYPEGGGAEATLAATLIRVRLDWPGTAKTVSVQDLALSPVVRPPAPDGAVEVSVSGEADERLDMLFLADGYTEDELDTFADDVDRLSSYLIEVPPFDDYTGLVNVWRVDSVSNESGSGESGTPKDTAYGCYYHCGGIERLLCCNDSKVVNGINNNLPDADGVLVVVNSTKYGGAGGTTYGTSYTGTYGEQVAAHEIGHSLIGLWDEYSYGYSGSGADGPNCSSADDGSAWEHWLDVEGVDAYEVCSFTNFYRATNNACMMNSLQDQYCPVCAELVVQQIYKRLPSLIVDPVPAEDAFSMDPESDQSFSATVLGPDDGSMELLWTKNGETAGAGETLDLEGCSADFELTLTVRDPTEYVRVDDDGDLEDNHTWTVTCGDLGGDDSGDDSGDDGSASGGGSGGGGVGDSDDDDDEDISTSDCGCAAPVTPAGLAFLAPLLLAVGRRRRD